MLYYFISFVQNIEPFGMYCLQFTLPNDHDENSQKVSISTVERKNRGTRNRYNLIYCPNIDTRWERKYINHNKTYFFSDSTHEEQND